MSELRGLFPARIVRGALLRPDGVAVGLVGGGAPSWDLLSQAARAQAGSDYHRLLLALDAPLDIYQVDYAPDLGSEIAELLDRQERALRDGANPNLVAVLGELADYLIELAQQRSSRARLAIWAVTVEGEASARSGSLDLAAWLGRRGHTVARRASPAGQAALSQAVERARRLAATLTSLGGQPPPRLLEAEEIARLLYSLADPVRAQRYPLAGALLERVRRIVTTD